MGKLGTLWVGIFGDTKPLDKDLTRAKSMTQKAGKAMGAIMKTAGIAATAAAAVAVYKAQELTREAVALAKEQEDAEKRLAAVVRSTGQAAGYSSEELYKMAAGFQAITTYGDETVMSGMAILATFKQIRGEGFERATQAALDMSEVMQQDLKSSIVMIGKALNDPIANLSAMSRAGVQFSKDQKDTIKTMWEMGDSAGAQAIILKELESQFGGAAAAAADTFSGAQQQAANALGDTKEELGFVITKNQFFVDIMKTATATFQEWGKYIKENHQYLTDLAKSGIIGFVDGIQLAIKVLGFFHAGWKSLKAIGALTISVLVKGLQAIERISLWVLKPFDLIFKALKKIGAIENNPFDEMRISMERMTLSSERMAADLMIDAADTKAGYEAANDKIEDWKKKLEAIPTTSQATTESVKTDMAKVSNATANVGTETTKAVKLTKKEIEGLANMFDFTLDVMAHDASAFYEDNKTSATSSFDDIELHVDSWANTSKNIVEGFAADSASAFSSNLYDVLTGKFDSLGEVWNSLWQNALKIFTDFLSKVLVKYAASGVADMFAGTSIGAFAGKVAGGTAAGAAAGAGGATAAGAAGGSILSTVSGAAWTGAGKAIAATEAALPLAFVGAAYGINRMTSHGSTDTQKRQFNERLYGIYATHAESEDIRDMSAAWLALRGSGGELIERGGSYYVQTDFEGRTFENQISEDALKWAVGKMAEYDMKPVTVNTSIQIDGKTIAEAVQEVARENPEDFNIGNIVI